MSKTVFLAGASGDLGLRILKQLHSLGAQVNCLVRTGTPEATRDKLIPYAADLREADSSDEQELARACAGADVIVSAVAGLRPVIIDFQARLMNAAIAAGVPRFIPSDFSIDYREIPPGDNRNLNLREEFRIILDCHPQIRATSILNGAFMDMLTGVAPFILFPIRRILCWGSPDQLMDFTTIDDTAAFTAHAALDRNAPRYLRIAGDELSARDLAALMSELSGKRYGILKPGGPGAFKALIALVRTLAPGNDELYPAWQGMQYMQNMYTGRYKSQALNNNRYPVPFKSAKTLLKDYLANNQKETSK